MRKLTLSLAFAWLILVGLSAVSYFVYAAHELLEQDTTVLPWLLLPLLGIVIAAAAAAALPAVAILGFVGFSDWRTNRRRAAQPTLGQLMARRKNGA